MHRRTAAFMSLMVLGALGAAMAAEDRKPTFEKSRPTGPRQVMAPLPAQPPEVPKVKFGVFKPFNPIDNFIFAKLKDRHLVPKPVCDDWDFARRTSLDLVGIVPTAADIEQFMQWNAKDRRTKWIDHLLNQAQYADHWTIFWGDLLRERGRIRGAPVDSLKRYIHENLSKNRPYDVWVRDMISAEGKPSDHPAVAFILRDNADAKTLTVTISQTFLGIQLKCAQCHDHPFDWWEQKDFDNMTEFWRGTRERVYDTQTVFRGGQKIETPSLEVISNDTRARGVFITGATSEKGRGRAALAEMLTRRDNPYFARVAVNKLWEKMMGVGLVNPSDNFSVRNPASHPELLDWLAVEFIDHHYDLKHILRLIANSRTYQQTSVEILTRARIVKPANASGEEESLAPGALYDGMMLRRMSAEQLQDSILAATGHYLSESRRYTPAIEVSYPPEPQSFLRTFGCPDRDALLPRSPTGSIQQSLTLLNGDLINGAIKLHPDHPIRFWQKTLRYNPGQVIDALFVQILTRPPTPDERTLALKYVSGGVWDWSWEDLQWALFNCREFQFIR